MSYRCATAALLRGDPLLATASVVHRWLLIEEPGGWGFSGLTTSRIEPRIAATVAQRANRAGIRVQLIRRPGRRHRPPERRVALVRSDPGHEQAWWSSIRRDADLSDLAFDQFPPPTEDADGWTPSREPIYLVCTHGRKDTCCAIWGRPVAANLVAHRPSNTWETTHVGGDRFAANLVVLPHGLYYGQIPPQQALTAAKAYEEGRVLPTYLRGRTPYRTPVQAAEHFARHELAESRLDGLVLISCDEVSDGAWRVQLTQRGDPRRAAGRETFSAAGPVADTTVDVTVRAVWSPLPAQLTCANPHATHYRTFDLIKLQVHHDQTGTGPA